ncbi:glycosyltransferase family 4 protein [Robinsoniella peoriensis]|uniref:Glycosyltransferase KanE n=1 Tax=Robinsoniella peoriensis TaxID=180332 RepID=A0A4U8QJC4_9FIRM|nr:glycosyltransferase family 4 protein [Robinsoniella peoriensis]MDU7028121.1 glycosyltransferase family 4 protein [Clostridiales bacterium]TLD01356.1 Glycosyltransferase KanE [Robinsoniella peoriensis]
MKLNKMNILFFTRTMKLGGTENVILQLCEVLKPYVNKIIVCSCGGVNVAKLTEMGIKHYEISDIAKKNPLVIIRTLFKLHKIIKIENINVIHSHHRMAAFYAQFVSKNIIKLANAHNTFRDKKKITKMAYKETRIIAVGEQVKKNLVEFFELQEKQIKVIYNGIKPFIDTIKPIKEFETAKQKGYLIIGNVGRLSEQKGMEYFIDAAEIVCAYNPKVKFYIIGDGEDRKILEERVLRKNLKNRFYFLGYRSDIQNVMSQTDILVLSSLWEGLPLTPIEAFSVGKTIIATAVDGTIEIVKNEENGILIPPKDSKVLAEKIQWMIDNSDKKIEMEQHAQETYEKSFSFHILADKFLEYYREL